MKINVDLSEVVPVRGANYFQSRRAPSTVMPPAAGASEGGTINPLAANAGNERRLSQAMTIALNASALISKALVAASRLRNMAQDSITGGNVDYREMSGTISDIRSSLSAAGMAYAAPAIASYTAPNGAKLPAIKDELAAIGIAADALQGARAADLPALDGAIAGLTAKQGAVDAVAARLGRSVDAAMGQYPGYTGAADYGRLVRSVTGDIAGNPQLALAAQGNLNPEKVAGLSA